MAIEYSIVISIWVCLMLYYNIYIFLNTSPLVEYPISGSPGTTLPTWHIRRLGVGVIPRAQAQESEKGEIEVRHKAGIWWVPSGKLTVCYWTWWFIVDLPIENGGSFHSYVNVYQVYDCRSPGKPWKTCVNRSVLAKKRWYDSEKIPACWSTLGIWLYTTRKYKCKIYPHLYKQKYRKQ